MASQNILSDESRHPLSFLIFEAKHAGKYLAISGAHGESLLSHLPYLLAMFYYVCKIQAPCCSCMKFYHACNESYQNFAKMYCFCILPYVLCPVPIEGPPQLMTDNFMLAQHHVPKNYFVLISLTPLKYRTPSQIFEIAIHFPSIITPSGR